MPDIEWLAGIMDDHRIGPDIFPACICKWRASLILTDSEIIPILLIHKFTWRSIIGKWTVYRESRCPVITDCPSRSTQHCSSLKEAMVMKKCSALILMLFLIFMSGRVLVQSCIMNAAIIHIWSIMMGPATICAWKGHDEKLKIPASLDSRPVSEIGERAFCNCKNLTSIEIPDGVTIIGPVSFYGCKKLTSITIPSSVISIQSIAFASCTSLKSFIIPDGITSIGNLVSMFRDNYALQFLTAYPCSVIIMHYSSWQRYFHR